MDCSCFKFRLNLREVPPAELICFFNHIFFSKESVSRADFFNVDCPQSRSCWSNNCHHFETVKNARGNYSLLCLWEPDNNDVYKKLDKKKLRLVAQRGSAPHILEKVGGTGVLTKHLIHHQALVTGPSLNSWGLQCHAPLIGGVAVGWGNWIGIRHWVSDNKRYPSLSWHSALLSLRGIHLVIHAYSSKLSKDRRAQATRTGWVWWSAGGATVQPLCEDVWTTDPPKAQGSFVWSLP